jgi:PQQ-like domain
MWHHLRTSYGGSYALTSVLHGDQLWTYDFTWGINAVLSTTDGAATRTYSTRSAPVFAGDAVVDIGGNATASDPPYLEAREASTGALLWHQPWNGFNQPFVAGAIVYTQLVGGGIDGFDVRTGTLVWTGTSPPVTDLSRYQSMAAAHSVLLVPIDNTVTAFG